jgi:hypothetical protein
LLCEKRSDRSNPFFLSDEMDCFAIHQVIVRAPETHRGYDWESWLAQRRQGNELHV